MALSSAGWEAAALTVKYSCASLALIRALARPKPSSKVALAALKFRTARRSNEANCEPAKPSRVSTPALFALAICSGVKYMVFFLQEEFGGCRVGLGSWDGALAVLVMCYVASQQLRFYSGNSGCQEILLQCNDDAL